MRAFSKLYFLFLISLLILIIYLTFINNHTNSTSNINLTHLRTSIISTTTSSVPIIESKIKDKSLSFICDDINIDRFPASSSTPSNISFDAYRRQTLHKYCNIVPIPRANWTKPQRYSEKDVAFVIFTASKFFHTRATAMRDTWLSRISNYYYLSATPYPYLPVTVVPGAGEDKLSNMKKLFYGLQTIYQHQMSLPVDKRQKWFYIIGCDTFILPHHLLKRIEKLDFNQPYLVGGNSGRYKCLGRNRSHIEIEYPSGGAGFFFSLKLLEILQPHLTDYVENIWPTNNEISDVAFGCLVNELGYPYIRESGFWPLPPEGTLLDKGFDKLHAEPEPNNFHYIQPDEMYAIDEFYANQHFDRLVNDRNWDEVVEFSRRFMSSHYVLLRKKRQECTLPRIGEEVKLKTV